MNKLIGKIKQVFVLYKNGTPMTEVARKFKVDNSSISMVLRGKTHKDEYAEISIKLREACDKRRRQNNRRKGKPRKGKPQNSSKPGRRPSKSKKTNIRWARKDEFAVPSQDLEIYINPEVVKSEGRIEIPLNGHESVITKIGKFTFVVKK